MSVLLTDGPKCTLVASHAAPCEYADGTDRQTDGRTPDRYITLSAKRGQRTTPSACLCVGAAVARYDVDGGQNVRLGDVGVEVEMSRSVVAETYQRNARLTADVHSVDQTS